MSPALMTAISVVSAIVALGSFVVNARSTVRKDCRDDTAAAGEVQKMPKMQEDLNALGRKVRSLEAKLDQYGCWNAPHCGNWHPLSGPAPEGTI